MHLAMRESDATYMQSSRSEYRRECEQVSGELSPPRPPSFLHYSVVPISTCTYFCGLWQRKNSIYADWCSLFRLILEIHDLKDLEEKINLIIILASHFWNNWRLLNHWNGNLWASVTYGANLKYYAEFNLKFLERLFKGVQSSYFVSSLQLVSFVYS